MALIKIGEDEPFESALRRFKRQCAKAGILKEMRKRRYYEKPSIKKRRKVLSAKRQTMRNGSFKSNY